MRRTRAARFGAVAASLVLLLGACGSDDDDAGGGGTDDPAASTPGGTDEPSTDAVDPAENGGRTEGDGELVIGLLLPQSGNLASLGGAMISGGEMAARDINEAGGVLGKDVRVIAKDDAGGGDDALAGTSADELINNEGVDGIVGAAATPTTLAILDKVVDSGTVECSPSNTGAGLARDDEGLYFRTPPPDDLQAQALAKVLSDDGRQSIAVLSQNTEYGTGFVELLEPAVSANGAEIAADVTYEPDGTAFDAEVENALAADPDAIVLVSYPEDGAKVIAELIKQGAGPSDTPLYVTDGLNDSALYEQIDPDDPSVLAGARGTAASAAPEAGAPFFPDAFAEFAPDVESPIYSAQSYDCVILMALAAVKADSDAPADIAAEMINISKGESDEATVCNTFADCVEALDAGEDINYDGASGALDFNEYGEPSAGSFDVFTFGDDGATTTDEQIVVGD